MSDKTLIKKINNWIKRLKILGKSSIYKEIAKERIEILEQVKKKIEEELN